MFRRIESFLRAEQEGPEAPEYEVRGEYIGEAQKALDDWHAAENYFNSINDPDLVEYALYELEAARRKYEYLIRKLRAGAPAWEQR